MIDPPDIFTWSLKAETKPVPVALAVTPDSLLAAVSCGTSLPRNLRTGPDEMIAWTTRTTMDRSAKQKGISSGWVHKLE